MLGSEVSIWLLPLCESYFRASQPLIVDGTASFTKRLLKIGQIRKAVYPWPFFVFYHYSPHSKKVWMLSLETPRLLRILYTFFSDKQTFHLKFNQRQAVLQWTVSMAGQVTSCNVKHFGGTWLLVVHSWYWSPPRRTYAGGADRTTPISPTRARMFWSGAFVCWMNKSYASSTVMLLGTKTISTISGDPSTRR